MSAEIRQSARQEQGLTLTPQLKRSLEILQAPALDLSRIVEEELKSNPMLEDARFDIPPEKPQVVGESQSDDDWYDAREPSPAPADGVQEARNFFFDSIPDKPSLQEKLLKDAAIDAKNPKIAKAFEALLGLLDERGFLAPDTLDVLRSDGFSDKTVSEALELLRGCEPAGIGAFDMRESLMVQLERKGRGGTLAYRILENRYNLLMKRRVAEIAQEENRSVGEVEEAIAEIAKLKTSPAADYNAETPNFIYPDLVFKKDADGAWTVEARDDNFPKVRINPEYRKMAADGSLPPSAESFVKEKIRDGKALMDALDMRRKTVVKIGAAIILKQPDFFERGRDALRPMTMQDVADIVEVHPTTVGRAISGKYADTPFGLLPLKFFFSGGYESEDGESMSSESVKNKISKIVADESPKSPLSDAKIADMLAEDGLKVARRTVAKYREELGIPVKSLRKRF